MSAAPLRAEGDRFERRSAALIDLLVGILRGIQLVNDVDRLRRHPELRHEGVKCDDLFLLQTGLGNQVVELHPEHDLAIGAKRRRELLRHRGEVLLLVKRLPKKHPQLRVDRLRIIVTKEAEAGVDFLFEQDAVRLGEAGQHLDEQREQIRPLGHAARFAQRASHPAPASSPQPVGKRRYALDGAVDSYRQSWEPVLTFKYWRPKLSPSSDGCNASGPAPALCNGQGFMIAFALAPFQA